jgi:dTDP-L-rhamnose 4-epimerase
MTTVLITGGAGFIGSHLADELLRNGYHVRVIDCLLPQVHGTGQERPSYLSPEVELHIADIRDSAALERALSGVDGVFHLAAAVGVGQSMYEVTRYTEINNIGTAVLLEALIKNPVKKLVAASSMSIYGEGMYRDSANNPRDDVSRDRARIEQGEWEPRDSDGTLLMPTPTPESKRPSLASIYALSKYAQERMCLMIGEAYGIPTATLRLFNVFGSRQSLSNPYTGVLAIFASRLLNRNPLLIFEDGMQKRDFVSVGDVARAFRLAYESPAADGMSINVGSGRAYSILEVAALASKAIGTESASIGVSGTYRVGDIRHCYADITLAQRVLGYEPQTNLESGLGPFVEWLGGQRPDDQVEHATAELRSRGLTILP